MILTDVTFPGTQPLDELERFVHQQEEGLGPLVNLGNAGPDSVLTFNMSSPPPATFVILRATPGGHTPVVNGFRLVCQGNCLVAGQLMGVAALRSGTDKPTMPSTMPGSTQELVLNAELPAVLMFKGIILDAAAAHDVPPAIMAAIGSVESRWGTSALMQPNGPTGTGDRTPRNPKPPLRPGSMPTDGLGFGRGLMQIDWDSHPFARTGDWRNAEANISFACGLLAANRDRFRTQLQMSADHALLAAIAAYNAGFGGASKRIKSLGLKAALAPPSYGAKVLARVEFFRSNGFGGDQAPATLTATVATVPGGGPFLAPHPETFLTQSVPNGECVAFVRKACNAPHTSAWRQGEAVRNNPSVRAGTAIATFDSDGRYGNHTDGRSHAAIYLRQNDEGLLVLDQWRRPQVQPVHERRIRFGGERPVNDGDAFFVIE